MAAPLLLLALGCGKEAPLGKKSAAWGGNGISESSSGNLYRAQPACAPPSRPSYVALLKSFFSAENPSPLPATGKQCHRWAVVTTIFAPSSTIKQIAALPGWCLVVAGDKKTPTDFLVDGVVYLSPEEQERMPFSIARLLRWNHVGRKNLAFLYAIHHGAKWVYDFDDDNLLKRIDSHAIPAPFPQRFSEVRTAAKTVNLYPRMSDSNASWPRGYPLESINPAARAAPYDIVSSAISSDQIGVLQSLADHDPDVDGFYRLHGQLPFSFPHAAAELGAGAALPIGTMMPYNAQATLYAYKAFWGLLLPITVHGRVTDIWRSYFTQRLLWDIDARVAFAPPWVEQYRNAHNILGDFNSEEPLYSQAGALVDFLLAWKPTSPSLRERIEELYTRMYEIDLIGSDDVDLLKAWLNDLVAAGYKFPELNSEPPEERNAVCLCCFHPEDGVKAAWPTIQSNVVQALGPKTDLFVFSYQTANTQSEKLQHVYGSNAVVRESTMEVASTDELKADWSHCAKCAFPFASCACYKTLLQLKGWQGCHRMIKHHEQVNNVAYTNVAISRPDVKYTRLLPFSRPSFPNDALYLYAADPQLTSVADALVVGGPDAASRFLSSYALLSGKAAATTISLPYDPSDPAAIDAVVEAHMRGYTLECLDAKDASKLLHCAPAKRTFGRTAICMTGFPRSLFYAAEDLQLPGEIAGDAKPEGYAPPTDAWVVAHSIRTRLLAPLAAAGGYDLFVLEPGERFSAGWEVLDIRAPSGGVPNRRIMMLGGAEVPLWFNETDPRWASFSMVRSATGPNEYVQNVLYQLRHQRMCNEAVQKSSEEKNVVYTYKVRLRPDWAWFGTLPPLKDLPFEGGNIIIAAKGGGREDTFAVGLAGDMDQYFAREPHIHTIDTRQMPNKWIAEHFLEAYLKERNLQLKGNNDVQGLVVRPIFGSKGRCSGFSNKTHECPCVNDMTTVCVRKHKP